MDVDIAIVGAGPAGVATAVALHNLGIAVAVLDRAAYSPPKGESLPPESRPVLEELKIWTEFAGSGQSPSYGNRSSWGSSNLVDADFVRSPHGNGWHLDRPSFNLLLRDVLMRREIPVVSPARVLGWTPGTHRRWCLDLVQSALRRRVEADIIIDASGRTRCVARMLEVPRLSYDRLVGILGILTPRSMDRTLESCTVVEAVANGWWYLSPLPDGRVVAGYMTDTGDQTCRIARTHDGWLRLVDETVHVRERLKSDEYVLSAPLHRVAATSSRLDHGAGTGWYAVGDAAATYDPLSSQGIVSALKTGRMAAQTIASADCDGVVRYDEFIRELYARYLANWLTYYAAEMRWPDRPFWKRRHHMLQALSEGEESAE